MAYRSHGTESAGSDWRSVTISCVNRKTFAVGLLGTLLVGAPLAAQNSPVASRPMPGRLTVRPHEMATGTQNPSAGEYELDSLAGYYVYVPEQCTGQRRCPLVVFLPGGGEESRGVMDRERPRADENGMILFVPTAVNPGRWDLIVGYIIRTPEQRAAIEQYGERFAAEAQPIEVDSQTPLLIRRMPYEPDVQNVDAALKQILRKFAIDPEKIALAGASDGGSYALFLGRSNLDVFSRIVPRSPAIPFTVDTAASPHNAAVRFLLTGGMGESGILANALNAAKELQANGHPVHRALGLRPHDQRPEDHAYAWRWIRESWAAPSPAAVISESPTVLTAEALSKMVEFWKAFVDEPDSIATTARLAHLKEIGILVGRTPMSVLVTDMPALAAQYPPVASALAAAGLTAQQYQAYRLAFISAQATELVRDRADIGDPDSTLQKNIQLLEAHPDDVKALEAANMLMTP